MKIFKKCIVRYYMNGLLFTNTIEYYPIGFIKGWLWKFGAGKDFREFDLMEL